MTLLREAVASANSKQVPGVFDPSQPNGEDLLVRELAPALSPVFLAEGFRLAKGTEFPSGIYMKTETDKNRTLPDVMREVSKGGNSRENQHEGLFDIEDRLIFLKGEPADPKELIVVRPYESLRSPEWRSYWRAVVDVMVKIGDGFSPNIARSLVSPQSVRAQFRDDKLDVGLIHRDTFGIRSDSAVEWMKPSYEDDKLFYFHFLNITRNGRYPFSEEQKPEIMAAIAEVMRKNIVQEREHRDKHLAIYRACLEQGVNLTDFLAAISA